MIFSPIDVPTLGIARIAVRHRARQIGRVAADRPRGLLVGPRLEGIGREDREQVAVLGEERCDLVVRPRHGGGLRRGRRGAAAAPSACAGGSRPGPRRPSAVRPCTSAVISCPRWAGRQCSTTTSSAATSTRACVQLVQPGRPACARRPRPPGPCSPTRPCRARRPRCAAAAASSVVTISPPVSAAISVARCTTCGIGSNPGGVAIRTVMPAFAPASRSECATLFPSPR